MKMIIFRSKLCSLTVKVEDGRMILLEDSRNSNPNKEIFIGTINGVRAKLLLRAFAHLKKALKREEKT